MSILNRVKELQAQSLTITKIKAFLTLEDYSAKEITAALKEAGVTGGKPKTFASEYYDWLAERPRTLVEAEDYIMGLGEFGETTNNVQKHKSHYLNIADLTIRVWVTKSTEAEPEQDERAAKIKAAWDKLATAKGKARKTKSIHPDKVSHLNDDELTKAYNDYFKNA